MQYRITPISPTEAVTLPRHFDDAGLARADVGRWLSEVQVNRCLVDRTCFLLWRGERPAGYLLGLTRHGHALCTGLEIHAGAAHVATWHLVHAFMERLIALRVDAADFSLSPRADAAAHMLIQLGAKDVGTRDDPQFGEIGRAHV